MNREEESFEKFNYSIRPSKQVERKLIIELLHFLGHKARYSISDYTYLGFGSVFYTDFILFHKYLYMNNMICVEASDIPKRMRFNRPYRFIQLRMKKISDVIPRLDFKQKYVVWLDYDYGLDYGHEEGLSSILDDVDSFIIKLSPGSIFFVTSEAEPRLSNKILNESLSQKDRLLRLQDILQSTCKTTIQRSSLTKKEMPIVVAKALAKQITNSATKNDNNVVFHQLINFEYADGARMVTVGGIIDAPEQSDTLVKSGIFKQPFTEATDKPRLISVPPLTVREKQYIDARISKRKHKSRIRLKFELKKDLLKNYLKYYKHYPTYQESVL